MHEYEAGLDKKNNSGTPYFECSQKVIKI